MRVLLVGDIFGSAGLRALSSVLPGLIQESGVEFVIANGENSADGLGITKETAQAIRKAGVSVITTGNHVWYRRQFARQIVHIDYVVRPLNLPPQTPGKGVLTMIHPHSGVEIVVINLLGRVFMKPVDCPFRAMEDALADLPPAPRAGRLIMVDFHGEATSEKQAMGYFLDGRVTMVAGTHTHVQTGDERILEKGTAYITDLGFTGPDDSIIGQNREQVLNQFITQFNTGFKAASGRPVLEGAIVDGDPATGLAVAVQRVRVYAP